MKQRWQQVSEKFEAITPREKWLVAICGWVAVVFIFALLLIEPLQIELQNKQRQIATLKGNNGQIQIDIARLQVQLKKNPDAELDEAYQKLLIESQELAMQISQAVKGLVTPSEMAQLLEQVLHNSHKLKLVSLTSLGNEVVNLSPDSAQPSYYIHPVKLELTGRYFDIKDYLAQLEAMPVKYYWRSLNYQVEQYPQARLTIVVYTLSEKQEFISG